MKRFFLYLIFFILICFIIPAILTKKTVTTGVNQSEENMEQNQVQADTQNEVKEEANIENYQYNKYGTIMLLHKKEGNVEEVNIDEYLYHVVSAEMPATFEIEALRAQAIVARTYTIFKILNKKHDNADICDDSTCCQAWVSKETRLARWNENERESNWQKICNAVNSTKGKIVTYENKPINAFFHSNSGGVTEVPINVWGGTGYPYLQSVATAGEDGYTQYASEVILTRTELLNKLKAKYSDISINFSNPEEIKILEYTGSNRVKTLKIGNHNLSGVEARTIFGLKSANFEIAQEGENIKFTVKGYGHGVGMSQTGADAMAKQGSTAEEIITHFYTGIAIQDTNSL
ncbi:MAG: stage II sporulation protein D [Clostridia bacterium]|nr:stage II sporulation protein D [Clostridia bacterium]